VLATLKTLLCALAVLVVSTCPIINARDVLQAVGHASTVNVHNVLLVILFPQMRNYVIKIVTTLVLHAMKLRALLVQLALF